MEKSEYQRYLASREWAVLKEQIRERSGGKCERCGLGAYENTHHLTYERVGNELTEDLQALCYECHAFISGKSAIDPITESRAIVPDNCLPAIKTLQKIDSGLRLSLTTEIIEMWIPIMGEWPLTAEQWDDLVRLAILKLNRFMSLQQLNELRKDIMNRETRRATNPTNQA